MSKLIKLIEYLDTHYLYYLTKHGPIQLKLNINLKNNLAYFFALGIYSDQTKIIIRNIEIYHQDTWLNAIDLAKQLEIDPKMSDLFYNAIADVLEIKDIE